MEVITVQKRDPGAKAKHLRHCGIVPCVICGAKLQGSLSVQMGQASANQLKRTKRNGSKVTVQCEGQAYPTIIKNLECNSITGEIEHINFQILDAGKKVNSVADIVLLNKDKVVGVLEQMQMKIPHAAQPEDLIDTVKIDLENLPVGSALTIAEIPEFQSDKIELQIDASSIVFRINDKKIADKKIVE